MLLNDLVDLSDFAGQRLLSRVAGLKDEEYFWEPVPDCWTIRPAGDGTFRGDSSPIPPVPSPFTTLAWRITHVIDLLQAERTATWFGLETAPDDGQPGVPGNAADALRDLEHAYAVWRRRLSSISEQALRTPMGAIAKDYAERTGTAFALHILDELIHHGAEVGVVRDLYAQTHPRDPVLFAYVQGDAPDDLTASSADHPDLLARVAGRQRWDVVRRLARSGFDVNQPGPDGATAAHLAAGTGELETLKVLVECGADLTAVDPTYQATPLGWAHYFGQRETAAYLA